MNYFDLSGKVAIVTGGNSGIGLGMARGLAEAGASVVIAARNEAKSKNAVHDLQSLGAQASAVSCDVTDQAAINTMVDSVIDQYGTIDILINNAGTSVRKRPEELSAQDWHLVLDTNLTSAFLCSNACYPVMKKAGGGKILNNGSMMSLFGSPWASAYAASKGGIVQLTKSQASAWAGDNIQVNCFLPGWIDTALTQQARQQIDGLHEKIEARTPQKRWGHINDFRGIAVFLASPAADFITGTAIPVDGGFSISVM